MNFYSHAFPLPYRWLRLWLVCFFAAGIVTSGLAVTATQNGPPYPGRSASSTATVTAVYNASIDSVVVTYSLSASSTNQIANAIAFRRSSASGLLVSIASVTTSASGLQTNNSTATFTLASLRAAGYTTHFYFQASAAIQGPSGSYNTPTIADDSIALPALLPQAVTITPSSYPKLVVGSSQVFTAGAGATAYTWAATGGTLTGTGSTRTFTAGPTVGPYTVSVFAASDATYQQSNTATVSGALVSISEVPEKKKYTWRVENPFDVGTVRFSAIDSVTGQVLGSVDVKGRSKALLSITKVGNNNVRLTSEYITSVTEYVRFNDGSIGEVIYPAGSISDIGLALDADFVSASNVYVPAVDKAAAVPTTPPSSTSTVGSSTPPPTAPPPVTQGNAGAVQWSSAGNSSALTDSAFKEGVGALATELQGINQKLAANAGGGSSSDLTGVETRLDTANEHLEKLADQADAVKAATEANPAAGVAAAQGAAASSAESATVKQFTAPVVTSTGSMPVFGIALPSIFGGKTFDLNPFQSDRFASICAWHRKACEWLAVLLFGLWCAKEAGQMIRGVNTANQAKGNTVVAGTGGQATALIAAAAITAVAAVALVAIGTFASTNFGGGTLLSLIDDDPFSGLVGGAVWMMDQLFPLGAVVACFAGRLVWQAAAQSAYVGAAAFIRFIVP